MKKGKLYIVIRPIEDGEGIFVNGPAADHKEAAKWYRKLVKHDEFEADKEIATIEWLAKADIRGLEAESISPVDDVLTPYEEDEEEDTDEVDPALEDEDEDEVEDEDDEEVEEVVVTKPKPRPRTKPAAKPAPAARPRRRTK